MTSLCFFFASSSRYLWAPICVRKQSQPSILCPSTAIHSIPRSPQEIGRSDFAVVPFQQLPANFQCAILRIFLLLTYLVGDAALLLGVVSVVVEVA